MASKRKCIRTTVGNMILSLPEDDLCKFCFSPALSRPQSRDARRRAATARTATAMRGVPGGRRSGEAVPLHRRVPPAEAERRPGARAACGRSPGGRGRRRAPAARLYLFVFSEIQVWGLTFQLKIHDNLHSPPSPTAHRRFRAVLRSVSGSRLRTHPRAPRN
eukprot:4024222-Prymnesium_polylepis.1